MPTLQVTVQGLRGHQAVGRQEQDGVLPLDRPAATGGDGLGFNGGHLLLLGWGACFKSTLVAAAEARSIEVRDLHLAIRGEMADTPPRFAAVNMEVVLDADAEQDEREKLIEVASRGCAVSNTLRAAADMNIALVDSTIDQPSAD